MVIPVRFQVPERIRAMNASVKLLLIVREPVTRAISDYTQLRSHAATPSSSAQVHRSFEQLAIRPDGSVNANYKPLAVSLYHTFTHRWLEVSFSRCMESQTALPNDIFSKIPILKSNVVTPPNISETELDLLIKPC